MAPATVVAAADAKPPELPAIDVIIDEFQLGDHALGKLELLATPQQRDWRIERLRLANPDGTLNLDGTWQTWLTQPATQVNESFTATCWAKSWNSTNGSPGRLTTSMVPIRSRVACAI